MMRQSFRSANAAHRLVICVVLGVGTTAMAQTSLPDAAAPVATAPTAQRPPVARQIVPMVAPVKRVAPKANTPPTGLVAGTTAPATSGITTKSIPAKAAAALAVPTARPAAVVLLNAGTKYRVYTCKIGQDYSEKLKSCFTPGVTKAASTQGAGKAASKAARARIAKAVASDTSGRSALGAKLKR